MSRPEVWAVVSDLHCGSSLGLCHPDGVQLDDGGWYKPSDAQIELWKCWEDYWREVKAAAKGLPLVVVVNGDLTEGLHHHSSQIVSKNLAATQHRIAADALAPAMRLRPKAVVLIRGTEAHVGASAEYEERLADDLGAVRSGSGAASHWHFQAESGGCLLDFAHHGRMGARPWTKLSGPATLAAQITLAAAKQGVRCPDLAIRSHCHQSADSGDNFPCRVIQTAAWQLSTAFVHRIAAGSVPDIGGLIVSCEKGRANVQKVQYPWKRSEPWSLKKSA